MHFHECSLSLCSHDVNLQLFCQLFFVLILIFHTEAAIKMQIQNVVKKSEVGLRPLFFPLYCWDVRKGLVWKRSHSKTYSVLSFNKKQQIMNIMHSLHFRIENLNYQHITIYAPEVKSSSYLCVLVLWGMRKENQACISLYFSRKIPHPPGLGGTSWMLLSSWC